MPAVILALLSPLIALYLKFSLAGIFFRILIFDIIFVVFNNTVNTLMTSLFSHITSVNLPCSISWVFSDLKLVAVLSIYINIILSASTLKLIFSLAIRTVK